MDTATDKKPGGSAVRWVLGLSLALNLLFVGAVAGALLREGGPVDRRQGPETHAYGAPYVKALPREARRDMRRALRRERGLMPSRADQKAIYDDLLMALRAEPFEVAPMAELFEKQRKFALDLQVAAQKVWLEQVSEMTVEDRAAFADRLQNLLERGPRGGDGDKTKD